MNAYRVRKFQHERSSVQIASIHAARQRLPVRSPRDAVKAKGNSTVVAAVGEIFRQKFSADGRLAVNTFVPTARVCGPILIHRESQSRCDGVRDRAICSRNRDGVGS
jgi:hypothetical protein